MRSKLFVPGSRPELFAKALAGGADAVSFDLEDAVPAEAKDAARQAVAAFLASDAAAATSKRLIVRCNPLGSPEFARDIAALAVPGPVRTINLPKPESARDVSDAAQALSDAERANGVAAPIALLANIETPRALLAAASIAAQPRVTGLQLGLLDLFGPHGIDRADARNVHAAMFALRMAAAAAGVEAIDAASPETRDEAVFLREAAMARALGFAGKSCIHPVQVAWANRAFSASPEEIAHARRVVQAAEAAAREGHGAFLLDGRMVDAPVVARARAVLASVAGEDVT